MDKTSKTVNDAQLKSRRTSLGKKTKEELINIVLRKDSIERNNNAKITALREANLNLTRKLDSITSYNEGTCETLFNREVELKDVKFNLTTYKFENEKLIKTLEKVNKLNRLMFRTIVGISIVCLMLSAIYFI